MTEQQYYDMLGGFLDSLEKTEATISDLRIPNIAIVSMFSACGFFKSDKEKNFFQDQLDAKTKGLNEARAYCGALKDQIDYFIKLR